jgi:hypothetical protein
VISRLFKNALGITGDYFVRPIKWIFPNAPMFEFIAFAADEHPGNKSLNNIKPTKFKEVAGFLYFRNPKISALNSAKCHKLNIDQYGCGHELMKGVFKTSTPLQAMFSRSASKEFSISIISIIML